MIEPAPRGGSIWTAIAAVLGALALAGLIILMLLLLGCEPPHEPPSAKMRCDYCKVEREKVRAYTCESCRGMHFSCPVEFPMLNCMSHWSCWITACPQKGEPSGDRK